ncbi:hypothetical protein RhiirC2_773999 [Rhizophagus irregularis]|uniref:Uncharacterized protein n=1 Tax=Rhizophagus irregularis TaxID=588596 RepID=A0A2N1NML9_9GLOM|nr:hypothetical protein RhiirC2_773999 [Rhizophagus irregularis]
MEDFTIEHGKKYLKGCVPEIKLKTFGTPGRKQLKNLTEIFNNSFQKSFDIAMDDKVLCDTREPEVSSNIEEFEESDTGEFEGSGTEEFEFESSSIEEFEGCNAEESKARKLI